MKKKILFLWVLLSTAVCTFAYSFKSGDLYYDITSDSTVAVTRDYYYNYNYLGLTSAVIPESVTYNGITYSVTSIGDYAFDGCTGLTSVTIPNSVTSVESSAFIGCSGLTSVIWNAKNCAGWDYYSDAPFYDIKDSITSFTFGNEVENIPDYICDAMSKLTSVVISNSVKSIGKSAFYGCRGLTSITIPNSVTSIGKGAFKYVPNIVYNGMATGSPWGAKSVNGYVDGYLIYADATKTTLLSCSSAATGDITIPNSVTSIGDYIFYDCSGITSITIPNCVTSVGKEAFKGCRGLTSVTWNAKNCAGWDSYSDAPFYDINSITSFTFDNEVESIPDYICYRMYNLTSMTIPNNVTSIGDYAFYGCTGLTSVTIGNSVTSIGDYAFQYCSGLTSVTIPNSVTSIGCGAFYGCWGLTSVTIPNGVTSIEGHAFGNCSGLTSITIPNSVTSIGEWAFYDCWGLTSVTIPNSVTSIGPGAFQDAFNIVYFGRAQGAPWGAKSINGYIDGYLAYSSATKWKLMACNTVATGTVTIPNSVTSIGDRAFIGCTGLTTVTIPESVTSIGEGSLCSLRSVRFKSITPPICDYAFLYKNKNLAIEEIRNADTLYIPCGTKIDYEKAFVYYCDALLIEEGTHTISVGTEDVTKGTAQVEQQPLSCNGDAIISATPAEHYRFAQWNDGNTDNPRTVAVTRDTTYTAEFISIRDITTVYDAKQGVVSGGGTYDYGTQVQLLATPAEHYRFAQWSDGNTDNPRTIVVTEDATYTAEFIAICNITVVYDVKQGYVSGDGIFDYGTRVRLVAEPNSGYKFLQWSDGTNYNPYIFAATEDVTLEAVFGKATAMENTSAEDTKGVQKILHNGQIYILRNGKVYDVVGQEVEF